MSLRIRLVLLVSALVLSLLAGLGLYLRASIQPWAMEALDHDLEQHAHSIAAHLEVRRSGIVEVGDEGEQEEDLGPYLLHDATGVVLAGRGLDTLDLGAGRAAGRSTTVESVAGQRWRVLSQAVHAEHEDRLAPEQRPLILTVGAPASRYQRVLDRFQVGLGVAVFLGLILGGLGATLIGQLTSAPLRRLSAEVSVIEAHSIDRRLSMGGRDPDLARLGGAINGLLGRLEGAFEQQRRLLARASHALRTPVASLLMISEVALRRERSNEAYRQALAEVRQVAGDAGTLVEQILALARIEGPASVLEWEVVELPEVGAELARLFQARAEAAGLELIVEFPKKLHLRADRARLREALEALLDNALRYTPRGGQFGLGAEHADGGLDILVWDTGPGIDPEELPRLGERFYRGHAAQASGPGSGLGLSIVHAIAEAHGAHLRLEPRPGGGTVARLHWTAVVPPAAE